MLHGFEAGFQGRVNMSSTRKLLLYHFYNLLPIVIFIDKTLSLEPERVFVIAVNTVMEEMKTDSTSSST